MILVTTNRRREVPLTYVKYAPVVPPGAAAATDAACAEASASSPPEERRRKLMRSLWLLLAGSMLTLSGTPSC